MADWTARRLARDFWTLCDVCGRPVRQAQTTRRVRTIEQRGLRVCYDCRDEPAVDDLREIAARRLARAGAEDGEVREP